MVSYPCMPSYPRPYFQSLLAAMRCMRISARLIHDTPSRSPTPLTLPPATPPAASDLNIPADDDEVPEDVRRAHKRLLNSQRVYHGLMILLTVITVCLTIIYAARADRINSSFVLPAAWAIYNSIGPIMYLLSIKIQQTKKLGLWLHILKFVSGLGWESGQRPVFMVQTLKPQA